MTTLNQEEIENHKKHLAMKLMETEPNQDEVEIEIKKKIEKHGNRS